MEEWSDLLPLTPGFDEVSAGLPIALTIEPHAVVCHLSGEVDIANASALAAALLPAVSDGDGVAVIDIGGVDFFDSNFLRALLACERGLAFDGIDLKVRNASQRARHLFAITRLERLLE
jgi:anti-anti-sigma factor